MAQIQRQNNYFAAEDWRTIYRTFGDINFAAYDFDTIKSSMVEYIRRNFPEEFNDFIESSEFIAIIELLAYMGQTIAFRQDLNTRENFLDTAERTESIRRLARMLSYNPKRNVPAAGVLKIFSIATSEEIIDSSGNNLANQVINWNDSDNADFLEQMILVLNAAFLSQNPYGTPVKKGIIDNIPVELYTIDTLRNQSVVYDIHSSINNQTFPFEIVNGTFEDNLFFKEIEPDPQNGFNLFYLNDGLGNNSNRTGFFMYLKQGALTYEDFALDVPLSNREILIDKENINNFDVWCQSIDANANILDRWTKVPNISGNNIIYNSLFRSVRKIFTDISLIDDKVLIKFADGVFGDIPHGIMRIWYRQSANAIITVRPENIELQTIQIPYVDKNNISQILSVTLGLVGNISNSLVSESNEEIKINAPQTFYTQDRMVNGEDYNIYPLSKNSDIIKIKAVNRTHAGHSRHLDINDPTGTVQNLNIFAEDGIIYKDEHNLLSTVDIAASTVLNTIILKYIQPELSKNEVINFYYDSYKNSVYDVAGNDVWTFNENELIKWVPYPNSLESKKGYFVLQEDESIITNYQVVGSDSTGKYKFIVEKALLGFRNDSGNIKYAMVENIIANGDPNGLNSGPVELNIEIPKGYILNNVYPKFKKIFSSDEQFKILEQLNLKNTFGIGYDYLTSTYYIIDFNNLSNSNIFSVNNAQNKTNNNLDASWIIKVEYHDATTLSNEKYCILARGTRYIFESEKEVEFYLDSTGRTIDIKTGQVKKDKISLLKVNTDFTLTQSLVENMEFVISDVLTYSDGYQDPHKVLVDFNNFYDDNLVNPQNFDKFVDLNNYIFQETYTDFDGYIYYKLSRNVIQINNAAEEYLIGLHADDYVGKYIYRTDEKIFKKIVPVDAANLSRFEVLTDNTDGNLKLAAFIGRSGYLTPEIDINTGNINNRIEEKIYFQWKHFAPNDQRINPSVTNLIDIFVLTKTYYDEVLIWKANNRPMEEFPQPPTNTELAISFNNLNNYKNISDQIIYRPVKFKLLFGDLAEQELQAKFKVIKTIGSEISDNEIKSQVIEAVNRFFLLNNWDMGESFYYTELAAFIHQSMPTHVSSVVLVPTQTESNFGNLFQVKAEADELFLPVAKVMDVEIVQGFTDQNLRIRC